MTEELLELEKDVRLFESTTFNSWPKSTITTVHYVPNNRPFDRSIGKWRALCGKMVMWESEEYDGYPRCEACVKSITERTPRA